MLAFISVLQTFIKHILRIELLYLPSTCSLAAHTILFLKKSCPEDNESDSEITLNNTWVASVAKGSDIIARKKTETEKLYNFCLLNCL